MRVLFTILALALPGAAGAADLSLRGPAATAGEEVYVERVVARPVRAVRTTYLPCIKCRGGLPWGGLRRTYQVELPWGGLPEYCPPVRAVTRAVVVTKG
jgi:hypothetical protein